MVHFLACFTNLLQWQIPSSSGPTIFSVIPGIEGEPPPPRSTPWRAYRSAISYETIPFFAFLPSELHIHTHSHKLCTHSHLVGRSMGVGYVPMVHTCSLKCANHTGMIAHTRSFNELVSTLVRWLSHMCQYYPWRESNSQHSSELLSKA